MRSYLSGRGDGPPPAAILDAYFQRYGWTWQEYEDTPEDVLQELGAVMAGEADHYAEQAKQREYERQLAEHRARRAQGSSMPTTGPTIPPGLQDAWDSGMPIPGIGDPLA